MTSILETVKTRKSIRSFDSRMLSESDRKNLERYISGITNPFGIPVDFVLLDASAYNLSSPVLTGEKLYIAGKIHRGSYAEAAFDYSYDMIQDQQISIFFPDKHTLQYC